MTGVWVLGVLLLVANIATGQEKKKNVLFLAVDDLRPNLNCYKDTSLGFDAPTMHTPNIDALAARSLLVEKAYVQQAVCNPSRTSLLTGRRPSTTKVSNLVTFWRTVGGNFTTIPQFFRENGYYTAASGKIFHCKNPKLPTDPHPWDWPYSWSEEVYHHPIAKGGHMPVPADPTVKIWNALTKEQMEEERPLVEDTGNANWAIDKMSKLAESDQPWFLAYGAHKPHPPFNFPEEFLNLYPEDKVHEPDNMFLPQDMPFSEFTNWPELRYYGNWSKVQAGLTPATMHETLSSTTAKTLRRAYYAATSYMDSNVGRVLQKLDDLGLTDSTVVVLWGDHGWQLGEHNQWGKCNNFEVTAHAPLILRVPGLTDDGLRTANLAEMVDIFPTLVEATGHDPLPACPKDSSEIKLCREGDSLMPLVRDPQTTRWKDAVFWQYPRVRAAFSPDPPRCIGYALRTAEYRYTEWVQVKNFVPDWSDSGFCDFGELYDLINDRKENTNLFFDKTYDDVRKELSAKLKKGWKGYKPEQKIYY